MPKEKPVKMKKVNFQLPEPLLERLDEAKWKERQSKQGIVRKALEAYFKKIGV